MPYVNQVQPVNFFANYLQGRQAAQDEQAQQIKNSLAQQNLSQVTRQNALYADPNATPEQFVRAGDTQTGTALQGMQDDKQKAVAQLGAVAQQALTIQDPTNRRAFLHNAQRVYAPAFQALGGDPSQALDNVPDDQLTQRLQQVAQFAPPRAPMIIPAGSVVATQTPSGGITPTYSAPGKVAYEDLGDQKVPVDSSTGVRRTDLPPLKKGVPPGQQFTDQSVEQTAQMIANGQIPMITGFALKTPWGQQVVARVGQIKPDYQGSTYKTETATKEAFAKGPEARSVRSLNVAMDHLDTLGQLADAMQNGDIQRVNQLKQIWQRETGSPAPTNFNAVRLIVGNEVVKAVTPSGGGVADREEIARQLDAKQSPAQLQGAIAAFHSLMGGQLAGLKRQYEQGTGQQDFERFLSPRVKQALEPAATPSPSASTPTNAAPVRIQNDADYAKLPSGTRYIAPDGSTRTKR